LNGKQWEQLFAGFSERQRAKQEQTQSLRELAAWYDEQTQLVMSLVREVVAERAAEFEQRTGRSVDVKWPSHPPLNLDPDGPFMSFMALAIPGREVHLYSHRVGLGPPMIHFLVIRPDQDERRNRVLGRAGCRIERREGGGFLLQGVGGGLSQGVLSVDDLVYRAFELLLGD